MCNIQIIILKNLFIYSTELFGFIISKLSGSENYGKTIQKQLQLAIFVDRMPKLIF